MAPVIANGTASTVTVVVTVQPVPMEYAIVVVPAAAPVTMPLTSSTDAISVSVLAHVPPVGKSDNAVVAPTQTRAVPVMVNGKLLMVNTVVAEQPPAV